MSQQEQPAEPPSPVEETPHDVVANEPRAAALIGDAVALVPASQADADRLGAVLDAHPGLALAEAAALTEDATVSPGMWSIYLQMLARRWDDPGAKRTARRLAMLSCIEDEAADPVWYPLISAAVDAMTALADPGDTTQARLQALYALAVETDRAGNQDLAYDLAAMALGLGPGPGPEREAVARYALTLGLDAGRTHQVAMCAMEIARCRIAVAGSDSASRLAAFDACETAIERIWQADEPFRAITARELAYAVREHSWLRLVCAPLLMLSERRQELAAALGSAHWPPRVQKILADDWIAQLNVIVDVMRFEQDIEAERLSLEPDPPGRHASIDWVSWTLEHPAYRRAVPHHQSFLRERDFDKNVLVLMHEMTHALSLLGGIGTALTALRVVALNNEVTMWSGLGTAEADTVQERIEQAAVAPLPPGDMLHLFRAERGLDLTLKAQALQDAWSPWFEGLAVFAEGAADPAADPDGISPVADALRNLIDFHPTPGPDGVFGDKAAIVAEFEALTATFESRVSQAIGRMGWRRLHDGAALLRERHYFAGYLAVRSVVAAWRRTLGRPVGGPEVLTLLLHATRFGTFDAVPDLSLAADAFVRASRERMARWAADLAALPAAELEDFLQAPARSGPGRFYVWRDGRLHAADRDDPEILRLELGARDRLAREAQATLVGDRDADRLAAADPFTTWIERTIATRMDAWLAGPDGAAQVANDADLIGVLLTRGSLFPVGRSASGYYLNVPPDGAVARLMSRLRTTEAHFESGLPSVNGFGFPVPLESARRLAGLYAETAMPRLSVTRLIDLGNALFPNGPASSHVLAWHHADWVHLQGPTQAADKLLREDPERLAWAHHEVRHRLSPSAAERAELAIAEGLRGALRTRDWIDATEAWEVPEVGEGTPDWPMHVRAKAERVLDQKTRSVAWRAASEALLLALWGKAPLARAVAGKDYYDLIAGFAPDELTRALFRCARLPARDAWLDANADRLTAAGLAVFEPTPHGWDVRAATAGHG